MEVTHLLTTTMLKHVQLTREWSFQIEDGFKRRMEDGNLGLWKPGRTIWMACYSPNEPAQTTLEWIKQEAPPNPSKTFEYDEGDLLRFGYLLPNADGERRAWELTAFTIAPGDYILTSFYFDEMNMLDWALGCWKTVRYSPETHSV